MIVADFRDKLEFLIGILNLPTKIATFSLSKTDFPNYFPTFLINKPRLIKSSGAQIVEIETNLFTYSLKLAYLI